MDAHSPFSGSRTVRGTLGLEDRKGNSSLQSFFSYMCVSVFEQRTKTGPWNRDWGELTNLPKALREKEAGNTCQTGEYLEIEGPPMGCREHGERMEKMGLGTVPAPIIMTCGGLIAVAAVVSLADSPIE